MRGFPQQRLTWRKAYPNANRMMFVHKTRTFGLLALLLGLGAPATAGNWEVCKMELEVLKRVTGQTQRIHARVLSVAAQSDTAECPAQGETVDFFPETADYQHPLRLKHWPQVGQTARWRYIYLDGQCKTRGPCRIRHHPIGW